MFPSRQWQKYFQIKRREAGVIVVEVVAGSSADSVGIAKGDIIFQVNGEDANDEEQFRKNVGDAIQTGSVIVLLGDRESGRTGYMKIPSVRCGVASSRIDGNRERRYRVQVAIVGYRRDPIPTTTAVAAASTPRSIPRPNEVAPPDSIRKRSAST